MAANDNAKLNDEELEMLADKLLAKMLSRLARRAQDGLLKQQPPPTRKPPPEAFAAVLALRRRRRGTRR